MNAVSLPKAGINQGINSMDYARKTAQWQASLVSTYDSLGLKYATAASSFADGGTSSEDLLYFYHSDHLGSSSLVTDISGNVTQHVEYVPFGEVFIEEHNASWSTPYKFNGKELDEETGLYYYGARYYDPRMSLWLGVDPLAEKYPNVGVSLYFLWE